MKNPVGLPARIFFEFSSAANLPWASAMIRIIRMLSLLLLAVCADGCTQSPSQAEGLAIVPNTPVSGSVGFDVTILPSSKGTTQGMATYSSQGQIAKYCVL
jgi:hypothetical protein